MPNKQPAPSDFGKIRSYIWPVYNYELKKILPMFIMFFCIAFIYTILRDMKDSLIMTAPKSGAEAIPFLKVWCVVPSAIFLMLIYAKLSNVLSKENLFYSTLIPFVIFFTVFGFIIYPNKDYLHPTSSADWLQSILPQTAAFKGIIAIYRNWSFSLFYVLAEMWGSMVLSLLFWGFANDITRINEAKRFYGLLGIGANLSLIFSGRVIKWSADRSFEESIQVLMGIVFLGGAIITLIYYWMNRSVLTDPRFYDQSQVKKKKKKLKMSILESIKYLGSSKYLGCITILVIAYGVSINLIEVVWKSQVKALYPSSSDYLRFMGGYSETTGYMTLFMLFFVSHNVLRRFGWRVGALITPTILLGTGVIFLAFMIFKDSLSSLTMLLNATPLYLAVMIGAIQTIVSKSSKYALFDPTKEMAYIPLDEESKVKGKAAIDVVGARLGKSGGSLIQMGLLMILPNVVALAPYTGFIFIAIILAWIFAANYLSKLYFNLTQAQEKEASLESTDHEKSQIKSKLQTALNN